MKICEKCGTELSDEFAFCTNCGAAIEKAEVAAVENNELIQVENVEAAAVEQAAEIRNQGLKTTAKVFMIIGTVMTSAMYFVIPLAWCLPMTISYSNKIKRGEKVSTGFKVCSLLFVSLIAGILMLCDRDEE